MGGIKKLPDTGVGHAEQCPAQSKPGGLGTVTVVSNDLIKITLLSVPKGLYHETWQEPYNLAKTNNFSNILGL